MSGKRSRTKGHNFERQIVKEIKAYYPSAQTSRYANRALDDLCVDITATPPFSIQCKNTKTAPNMHTELSKMPQDDNINLVFHHRQRKGDTVTLTKEDFYEILSWLKAEQII